MYLDGHLNPKNRLTLLPQSGSVRTPKTKVYETKGSQRTLVNPRTAFWGLFRPQMMLTVDNVCNTCNPVLNSPGCGSKVKMLRGPHGPERVV